MDIILMIFHYLKIQLKFLEVPYKYIFLYRELLKIISVITLINKKIIYEFILFYFIINNGKFFR